MGIRIRLRVIVMAWGRYLWSRRIVVHIVRFRDGGGRSGVVAVGGIRRGVMVKSRAVHVVWRSFEPVSCVWLLVTWRKGLR